MSEINIEKFKLALANFSSELSNAGIPSEGLKISIDSPALSQPLHEEISAMTPMRFQCHWGPGIGFTCTFGTETMPDK